MRPWKKVTTEQYRKPKSSAKNGHKKLMLMNQWMRQLIKDGPKLHGAMA